MIYLNTVNDKVTTSFDNYNIQTTAVEGSLLIWPAYWTHFHHGVVSHTQTKYIATGWIKFDDYNFNFGIADVLGLNPTRIK